jgi:hypothetical protein
MTGLLRSTKAFWSFHSLKHSWPPTVELLEISSVSACARMTVSCRRSNEKEAREDLCRL